MTIQLTATFDLFALRFWFTAREAVHFPEGQTANLLRGQLGKIMKRHWESAYARFFAPIAAPAEGPSGLHDPPRPFVFRVRHLDGARVAPDGRFYVGLNWFAARDPMLDEILAELGRQCLRAELDSVEGDAPLQCPLAAEPGQTSRLRVRFLSPTELKNVDRPEFGVLFARVRDRVSTLRALYGSGPIEIDFKAMGERASAVRMTRCELRHIGAERVSRRTGQSHSLGGFVGVAEYEGELAEFVPYLEIAQWTGVGRQTVWGKGEIVCETF